MRGRWSERSDGRGKLIPDLYYMDAGGVIRLLELKTIGLCLSRYDIEALLQPGVAPVNVRAATLQGEYDKHAQELDDKYGPGPRGQPGPFTHKLREFGPIVGAVFGNFAEGSDGAVRLLNHAARGIARKTWAELGARDEDEAFADAKRRLYRKWGIGAARARAVALRRYVANALGLTPHGEEARFEACRRHSRREREAHYHASTTAGLPPGAGR